MSKIDETTQPDSIRIAAQKLYESYTANSDNLNYRGEPCPTWGDLTPAVRSHWCATAIQAHDIFAPPRPSAQPPREAGADPTLAKLGGADLAEHWKQLADSGLVEKIRVDVRGPELGLFDTLVASGNAMATKLAYEYQ